MAAMTRSLPLFLFLLFPNPSIMGGCSGGSSSFLVDAQQQCSGDSEEGECKIDETGVSEGGTDPVPAKVLIINHGENPVQVFWIEPGTAKRILINDISSHRAINLDSFIGHEIEMSDKTSGELLKKHTVVIEASENEVHIGTPPKSSSVAAEKSALEALGGSYFPHPVNYISSFPRPSREIPMGAKFRNLYPHDLEYYYDDGTEHGAYNGVIPSMGRSMINTYTTHSFHICKRGSKVKIDKVTMVAKKNIIILAPKNDEKYMEDVKKTPFYKDVMKEVEFTTKYQQQKGMPWLSYYPRNPPILNMWAADYIGQEHFVEVDMENGHPVHFTLKVISLRPRVFYISGLLLPSEIDHVIKISKDQVRRSAVGTANSGFVTDTRTSRTAWIKRTDTPTMNKLFQRFSKVLNISDERLTHTKNAENLQVVHYNIGQKYSPHHDFNDKGSPPQRFATLFMYLKSADKGGGTAFPLAFGRKGLQVTPRAGSAILWYNMLPDGNADEMSLHEGQPVQAGEKWGCNLWVWDPIFHVS